MLLIEILMPEMGRKMYVSAEADTSLEVIKDRLLSVVLPKGDRMQECYSLINIDEMCTYSHKLSLKEAGIVNGSRLLFMRQEG